MPLKAPSLKLYADQVRPHLVAFDQLEGDRTTYLIQRVCMNLRIDDRKEWNRPRLGKLDDRRLKEFADWLIATTKSMST